MIRSLLAAGLFTAAACACAPGALEHPPMVTKPAPAQTAEPAGTWSAPVTEVILPPDATGFITTNPLPVDPGASDIRRDKAGRPYEYALLGHKLPRLTGTLSDGSVFDSDRLDNWTVILVWGVWCPDSRNDGPYSAALKRAIDQDPDLDFLSLHVPQNADKTTHKDMFGKFGSLENYFADNQYDFPTLLDTDASAREALKIAWTPSYLLVSPDGLVRGYRSSLADAKGEPVKDFIRDIAQVKADWKQKGSAALRIGPGGASGLPPGTPFTLEAVEAAFPGYQVISVRLAGDGGTMPAFEVRESGDVLLRLEPDWSLAVVERVSTSSSRVYGPHGERIGHFRLEALGDPHCTGRDEFVCFDPADPHFQRTFKTEIPGTPAGVLTEMSYEYQDQP